MFGKKKEPLPPYILQVLTTEYLIEGSISGETRLYFFETGKVVGAPLTLASAQIQATQAEGFPPRAALQYTVLGNSTVALIPHMQFDLLPQSIAWKQYKKPLTGTFYVGPYVMKGSMMLLNESIYDEDHPVFDVHITSQVPGSGWPGIYTPFALVNMRWLHGCIPDQA
jgi:hypothetical protein